MKTPDFIELPEFSEENPMIITGYYDKFEGFRIYSTYERRFGKMYFNTDVKIDNVELQLYSPRYDYNLGKCWMDGKCHFEVIVPAHKKQQSEVEV